MSRYFRAQVAENRPLNETHFLLTFIPLSQAVEPLPGQFYMIGRENDYDPLLKRPFSLFRRERDSLQILYRVKGRGTALMKEMAAGTVVDVLGPLGNAYPMPDEGQLPLLVAGGIGMASLFSLAESLKGRALIFYGGRTADELLMLHELRGMGKALFITTDDGSEGEKGTVIERLRLFLDASSGNTHQTVYACGPRPMLHALWSLVKERTITAYVSVEEVMACGIGACLGCVVKTTHGHQRVCKEGPVFNVRDIAW